MYNPQLDTFLVAADEGSFTKAAKTLYITPSAVLQQINSLEKNLDVMLFQRGKSGITLTPAGEYLQTHARLLKEQNRAVRAALKDIDSMGKRVLRIGVPKMHQSRCFYELWTKYSATHHDISLNFIESETSAAYDILATYSACDIIEFVRLPNSWQSRMNFLELGRCSLVFCVPRTNPLHAERLLTMEMLRGQSVVVNGGPFRESAKDYLNLLLSAGAEIEYVDKMNQVLFENLYIAGKAILLPSCSRHIHPGFVPVHCTTETSIPYGFVYSEAAVRGSDSFIDFARQQLESGAFVWTE